MTEREALDKLRETANKNKVLTSLIGQGYYGTITPPVIQRNILEKPGLVHGLYALPARNQPGSPGSAPELQTMVTDLTGLDVANASLLDEATAAAEAMALCQRSAKTKATGFFVDKDCHPQTIAVIQTRAERSAGRSPSATPSPISTRPKCLARSSSIPARTAMCGISPA